MRRIHADSLTSGNQIMRSSSENAVVLYASDGYAEKNPSWHLEDAPAKVGDILPACRAAIMDSGLATIRIADIGSGAGGVLNETLKQLRDAFPVLRIEGVGFEVSPFAIAKGREKFPQLDIREKFFSADDGPFSIALLVDVLEHLENPWEMLRTARATSRYLVVRQPLEEGFSFFRHNAYSKQREAFGHIGYFNWHSFLDMASATGWEPLKVDLLAAWELGTSRGSPSLLKRLFTNANRLMASHFLSGFYLVGAFRARDR
jgi:SAM-dependent methyltransferase